jgi:iron complex outermembrane receptor protein
VFRDRDQLTGRPRVTGDRETGGAALALDVAATDTFAIVSALRIDAARTDPAIDPDEPVDPAAAVVRWEAPWSPRLSARWLARPDVAIKGSVGRYARLPTVIELFGDRGFIVGSPALRPETGITADAGVVWAPAHRIGAFDRIVIEAAGFVGAPRDAIALVSTIGGVARAHNIGDARSIGGELVAGARIDDALTVGANYTLLDAIQHSAEASFDGKRLPRQPRHAAYARADFATRVEDRLAVVWTDIDWQSTTYLDRASLLAVPGRTLVGAGAKAEIGAGVLLGVEVRNLTDHRLVDRTLDPAPRPDLTTVPMAAVDVAGFPLPGRAFYVTAEWTH